MLPLRASSGLSGLLVEAVEDTGGNVEVDNGLVVFAGDVDAALNV